MKAIITEQLNTKKAVKLLEAKNEIFELTKQLNGSLAQHWKEIEDKEKIIIQLKNKCQIVCTERNTLSNHVGWQKVQAILKKTGCSERKEYYYEEEEEGYCISMDLESDDESIINLVSNRFKEIEIRSSEKSLKKQEKSSAPIDNKEIQKGNLLQDSIHVTKKLNKHEKMQNDQQHILGVMQINYTTTKEEMLQKINEDVINLNVNFMKIERFVNRYHHYEKQIRGKIWENGITDVEEIVIRSKNASTERIEKEKIEREEWIQVNIDILKED
ncbi:hypothetical protein C1645_744701 [Glomus cerebriforme]|uniref:Uncharacterized protein n=1 Tax=Glomus cerebriforme TaxID=658196 RepID=A0A397S8R7_9GLOM|nr:hypothetical protein C1645_744701 [Glomus cerebriforme]